MVRHPRTMFIGAHVGCAAEDLARVGAMLERAPTSTSTSPRGSPSSAASRTRPARFVERWPTASCSARTCRPTRTWWAVYYRFLETDDESFAYDADEEAAPSQGRWRIHGLELPTTSCGRVYHENAARLIRF